MRRRALGPAWWLLVMAGCFGARSALPASAQGVGAAGSWEPTAELIYPVRAAAVATDGKRIFVFGGTTHANAKTAYTQVFDPSTESWTLGADVPKRLDWGSVVYTRGRFHLLGGVTNEVAATNEYWIYDPVEDVWAAGPRMLSAAAGAAAVAIDDLIIVVGGIDGPSAYSARVRVFHLEQERWSERRRAPAARINWQGAELEGDLFVAGGSGPGRTTGLALYRYNPVSDEWSAHALASTPTEGYGAAAANGSYCVLGGRETPVTGSFGPPSDRVDCYEPIADRWWSAPSLPEPMQEIGAAALGSVLYAIGGRVSYDRASAAVHRLRL